MRQVQYWPVTALWAGLGMIGAMLVMELLGVEGHHAGSGTPHSILTDIRLGALEVGTDLALAAGLAWMVLQVIRVSYDEAGLISKIDIENIFTWRLFAFYVALPLAIYLMRSFEAAFSASLLSVDVKTWTLIQSDLLGYFIMLPGVGGAVLVLVGVPRLEPDLKPSWAYVLGYITLVVGLCVAIATETVTITSSTIIPIFGFIVVIGTLMPTLHIAGRLLILNFAGLFFLTQYIAFTPIELVAIGIAFSLVTLFVMLFCVIAQIKRNRAQELTAVYLQSGTGVFAIMSEEQEFEYASELFLHMTGYSTLQELPHLHELITSLNKEEHTKLHEQAMCVETGLLSHPTRVDTLRKKSGEEIQTQRTRRWFEVPGQQGRKLSVSYEDVTDRIKLEAERAEQESILNAFVFEGPQYCFVEDENFKIVLISEVAAQLLGNRPASDMIDLDWIDFLNAQEAARIRSARKTLDERLLAGETFTTKTPLIMERDGKSRRFEISVKLIRQTDKGLLRGIILNDVTEVYSALKAANTFLDSQLTAVAIQREDFSFYYISDAFKEQLGISSIEDMKDPANGFWENRDEAMVLKDREVLRALPTGVLNVHPDPFIFVTAAGERLYFQVQNKWIDNPSGEGRLLLTSFENITELLAQQQRLQDQADALEIQAKTDPLTGLWNRLGLNDQLQIVEGAERDQDLAVYLLDVDFFKSVNDTYSHRVGDDLLIAIGNTLRDVGQENAIVARLGGEEFLVATPWIDVETAKDFGGTLRRAVGETQIQSEGHTVSRTTSVGIAKLSRTDSLDTALSLADLALSEAKARGRNLDILADEAFHAEMEARGAFITEAEIEAGLLAHEFKYYVQPIYNTEHKEVEGFETLIRWIKPDGSVVPPDMFLGQFNKVFFKPELKEVRTKMRYDVMDNLRCYPDAYVSWNYELDQFLSDDITERFITQAREAVEKYGIQLVVEISERGINARIDMADIERNLQRIRDAGFLIALDDFGTEQSNINRLMRLPIDIIKFDKSLIEECDTDKRAASTIRALSLLANTLNIKVIGEGVETKQQATVLHFARVTRQQGYFHARPMDPEILATQDIKIGQEVTHASTTPKLLEEYLG